MPISVWPLEVEGNVVQEDLVFNFINKLFTGEGALQASDLNVSEDIDGVGVKVAPGGAIVAYDSAFGGKRVFYNATEKKSGPNEFLNPSFAVNTVGWAAFPGSPTIARDTGVFHSSPASCKVSTSGASTYNQGISLSAINMRVNSSELQEVSCWARVPVGVGVKLKVTEHNSALTQVAENLFFSTGTGDWQKLICGFTASSTTKFIWVEVTISSGSSQDFYVDDFSVNKDFYWINSFQTADPTNPRVDRIVAQIRDKLITGGGDTVSDGKLRVISGTPTAGATLANLTGAAAVPANCFLIANVLVPAAATSLVAGNISNAVRTTAALNVPSSAPLAGFFYEYGGAASPNASFLLCDGASYATSAQPLLFAVIGYTYGGSGANFNVPDFRGRVAVGLGTNADVNALGDSDGDATVGNRRPKHKHSVSIASDGSHSHGGTGSVGDHSHSVAGASLKTIQEGTAGGFTNVAEVGSFSTGGAGGHSHTISSDGSHSHSGSTVGPTTNAITDGPAWLTVNKLVTTGL